jgi:hypothetical protein
MKWYNLLISLIVLVGMSILVGYLLKKCPAPAQNILVMINIDSINKAHEVEKKTFMAKVDSLENKLKLKPKTIIIYETSKDSTIKPDTTRIPSIFRKLANYFYE